MSKKKTTEIFKAEVYDLVGNEYKVLGDYINTSTKILMMHNTPTCLQEYEVTPQNFLKGNRCSKCGKFRKKDTQYFKDKVFELTGNEYIVLGEYISSKAHVLVKHNVSECGREYSTTPENFYRGRRCASCKGKKRMQDYPSPSIKTHDAFVKDVHVLVGDEYSVISTYISSSNKVIMKHNTCNKEYEVRPNHFLSLNTRCPFCTSNAKWTNEKFIEKVNEVTNEYLFLEEYDGCDNKLNVQHLKCGEIYQTTPYSFINKGVRCPKCSNNGISKPEKELLEYIKSLLPNEEIIENDRKILKGKEIDILIPAKAIGIEFDGLYWHSSKFKDKSIHALKTSTARTNNIQLIHIFEDEWENKQDLIKKKISHILGCDNSKKIFARKCTIQKIEQTKIKTAFLNENHLQGADRANFVYGLYYKEELVALMSFIKPRINMGRKDSKEGEYELSRYATKYNVIGGFGKLLKYIINIENINEIYTYADLRWTNPENNIYLKNGFEYISTSQSNYWYVINNNREGRFTYQKAKLKEKFPEIYSDNKTEEQIMLEAGYYRIYDCGNLKYKLEINKGL